MDKMLYVGMSGAKQLMQAQALNTNNLANVSTTGFRGDFQTLIASQVQGAGMDTRFNVVNAGSRSNLDAGPIRPTGHDLDAAINGDGFFVVQGADGNEAYTRRGDFKISADGQLLNGVGQVVLGEGGPLTIPQNQSVLIGEDGTISVVPLGQGPETQVVVDRLQLVTLDPTKVEKGEDGLLRQTDGEPGIPDADVRVMSGHLEHSNVNAVEAMVNMISISRAYEMQVKLMSTAREMADTSSRSMRLE